MKKIKITIMIGDITKIKVDAIVNPANSQGMMGGGVAKAIREAGGRAIESDAMTNAPIPVGLAVATTGGKLNARFVIHSPTMEKPTMKTNVEKVRKAVRAALKKADGLELTKISMPGMGTGVGGLDYAAAAAAMIQEIIDFQQENRFIEEIFLVAYGDKLYSAFLKAAD